MSILEGVQDDYVAEYQVACLSEDGTSNIVKEFKVVQNSVVTNRIYTSITMFLCLLL